MLSTNVKNAIFSSVCRKKAIKKNKHFIFIYQQINMGSNLLYI